jgi:hypothetical protein
MNSETRRTRATILEEEVEAALQADPDLVHAPIGVAVQGTTVSLTGAVGSEAAREKAEQLARHVGGVHDVVDELVVAHHDAGAWPFLGASLVGGAAVIAAGSGLGAGRIGMGCGMGLAVGAGAIAAMKVMADAEAEAESSGYGHHEDTEQVKG